MSDPAKSPNPMSLPFVEALYADFLRDPASVPAEWRRQFEAMPDANGFAARPRLSPSFPRRTLYGSPRSRGRNGSGVNSLLDFDGDSEARPAATKSDDAGARLAGGAVSLSRAGGSHRVAGVAGIGDIAAPGAFSLIQTYRARGHQAAAIDPLGAARPAPSDLDPAFHGFSSEDLDRPVDVEFAGVRGGTLRDLLARLRATYCGTIGWQYRHIHDPSVLAWIQERIEQPQYRKELTADERRRILQRLTAAAVFEDFIQKKYIGSKSFSVEGCEALIPLLDEAIDLADQGGASEVVIGMAHRGRLNVLSNVLGKPARRIFHEFNDSDPEMWIGRGDVKYHLGYSSDRVMPSGRSLHLSLCFNPSHLEFVGPVAQGRMRAKQDRVKDAKRERGAVILIHGDAAFAGEGVVQETLNLSQLPAYHTGGTLHVIVNNKIGFTTVPEEARSSPYASDVARLLQSPIFHVNGEEPDAVARVVRTAMEFRRVFRRDVVIDLYGYRRQGHNEGDEPAFTQPLLYKAIAKRKPVHVLYGERLIAEGVVTPGEVEAMGREVRERLEVELKAARDTKPTPIADLETGVWKPYGGGADAASPEPETGVARARLEHYVETTARVPEGFHPHPKIARALELRKQMARGERPIDWASAEAAAFASLVDQGFRVRLTGQDSERGTFSHRHAVLHDVEDGKTYTALQNIAPTQAPFEIANSPLAESAPIGFEYGYSLEWPDGLVVWEAQFGDFANVAQTLIDQFLASGEAKWRRLSGLTLLLPHGFEGQGSEHSSARIERFLQLAARDNIQIAYPSTPAQIFHLLRRQVIRPWRKPLIVMTPKSLLRNPETVSTLDELATGRFQRLLGDAEIAHAKTKQILLCSGKIYYELAAVRKERGRADTAILRVEQLYPLADAALEALLEPYKSGTPVTWVQEEPENMGAWPYLRARFGATLLGRHPFFAVSRPESPTPASGAHSSHKVEQERLLASAFNAPRALA
ncbi:MAG TPA: 2-oxoglutarate dehydrogenase E1 component [Candidatus Eisenbacteria bacterium]|nr:2-oxoglutarate dehydrogenase E1 component [Candidatus Eisenbacteria bacterium]